MVADDVGGIALLARAAALAAKGLSRSVKVQGPVEASFIAFGAEEFYSTRMKPSARDLLS